MDARQLTLLVSEWGEHVIVDSLTGEDITHLFDEAQIKVTLKRPDANADEDMLIDKIHFNGAVPFKPRLLREGEKLKLGIKLVFDPEKPQVLDLHTSKKEAEFYVARPDRSQSVIPFSGADEGVGVDVGAKS